MLLAWRTQLREAQQACDLGRLDEAAQRVADHKLRQYKPGEDLAKNLAFAFQQRAVRRAEEGNFPGAWHDLARSRELFAGGTAWDDASHRIAQLALASVERHVEAGDYAEALKKLDTLARHSLATDAVRTSQEVIRRAESAQNLARRGKLSEAEELLAGAVALRPEWRSLQNRLSDLRQNHLRLRHESEALHQAMLAADWNRTLESADALLAIAPEYRLARDARQQAWAQVGAKTADSQPFGITQHWSQPVNSTIVEDPPDDVPLGTRFLLWVDGVGGYLVALADEVWLGQAAVGNQVAIPIHAELSRHHAKLRRSGDGYVLEPTQAVSLNGGKMVGKRLLRDQDEIQLGQGLKMRFRQPHPLSASARLEITSRHRILPGCNTVLLMAESCVLGPKLQDHIVCRDWKSDVVLYRQADDLFCRAMEPIEIDGVIYDGRGPIQPNSRVVGEDFSFTLEMLR
jgi:tetratricopeptide (TPR) repeat protein